MGTDSVTAPVQTPLCSRNLPLLDSAADWRVVDGRIRSRRRKSGRITYFIDFYPKLQGRDQRLYSHSGITLETREDAERIQQRIKALTDKGHTLAEAVGAYRQPKDRRNRVEELVGLTEQALEVERLRTQDIVARALVGPLVEDLRNALRAYLNAQCRMLERWAEVDDAVKRELWQALHACEEAGRAALLTETEAGPKRAPKCGRDGSVARLGG